MKKDVIYRQLIQLRSLAGRYKYVLVVAVVGAFLLWLPPLWGENGAEPETQDLSAAEYDGDEMALYTAEALERKLEEALSHIQGVGEVQVVLTLKSGPQRILAQDVDTTVGERSTESTLTAVILSRGSGTEDAVVVQQLSPQYQGALVICSGGDAPEVRLELVEAVSALTGLGADRISVCKGK